MVSDRQTRHSPSHGRLARLGRGLRIAVCAILSPLLLSAADADEPRGEIRDTILMIDTGPLHVRLHVFIGGLSPEDARAAAVARLIAALDLDGDGRLSRDEAQRSPLFREKQRPGAARFLRSINADMTRSRRQVEQQIDRFGGETVVYRQNTDESDTDGEVFKLLDADGDGVISEVEMINAVDLLLARDSDDDECITLDEVQPPPDPNAAVVLMLPGIARIPISSVADVIRDANQTLLARDLLEKYDTDRNRKLSQVELGWSPERLKPCDANGDGELDQQELQSLGLLVPDIELAVDVVRDGEAPLLRVLSSGGKDVKTENPDAATIRLPSAVITFFARDVDPFAASMAIALRTFNELDIDNNGYLDRDEASSRERFGRGLFDQIDADGDDKIFGEEMKEFIRARGEPIATTCHVTAHDDGAGFFSTLDTNGDRRISMREMRYADKALALAERDDKPGIGEHEPPRQYRIEFVRGVFNPFGSPDRPADPALAGVAARPRPVGPIWFQRWDRNNDGDLTWREFLGPRDVFEQLDVDRDGLIDPQEAEAAASFAGPGTGPSPVSQELQTTTSVQE